MKICKKCQKEFKPTANINGKHISLTGRSYCLDCSPYGNHNGYLIRSQETKAKYAECDGRPVKNCSICSKRFAVKGKGNICPCCKSWYRRYLNKQTIYTMMGNKCNHCGCTDQDTFTMHHTNPENKSFNLSLYWHSGIKILIEEAKKCIILCSNCHLKEHCVLRSDILDYYAKNKIEKKELQKKIKENKEKQPKIKVESKCIDCDKKNSMYRDRCKSCAAKLQHKDTCKRPSKEQLLQDVEDLQYLTKVGKKYNVSDTAVRKWFKFYELPIPNNYHKRDNGVIRNSQ